MLKQMTKLGILLPVYNDWLSAGLLIEEIEKNIETAKLEIIFFLVDDGSTNYEGLQDIFKKRKKTFKYEIIHLNSNIGHQRAIACGLSYISKEKKCNAVVIMDSDGEDTPVYLKDFLKMKIPLLWLKEQKEVKASVLECFIKFIKYYSEY